MKERRGPRFATNHNDEDEPAMPEHREVFMLGLTAVERFAAQKYLEERERSQPWEPMWRSWME